MPPVVGFHSLAAIQVVPGHCRVYIDYLCHPYPFSYYAVRIVDGWMCACVRSHPQEMIIIGNPVTKSFGVWMDIRSAIPSYTRYTTAVSGTTSVVARTMPYRADCIRYGPRRSAISRSIRNAIARLSYWQCHPRRCGAPETEESWPLVMTSSKLCCFSVVLFK
ncbi:hypothetical protein F5B18DRAFT_327984 [Nemania serpens]|nr:hypothetical protein F5B18DRAFT_327984 [Nemania serpens]